MSDSPAISPRYHQEPQTKAAIGLYKDQKLHPLVVRMLEENYPITDQTEAEGYASCSGPETRGLPGQLQKGPQYTKQGYLRQEMPEQVAKILNEMDTQVEFWLAQDKYPQFDHYLEAAEQAHIVPNLANRRNYPSYFRDLTCYEIQMLSGKCAELALELIYQVSENDFDPRVKRVMAKYGFQVNDYAANFCQTFVRVKPSLIKPPLLSPQPKSIKKPYFLAQTISPQTAFSQANY